MNLLIVEDEVQLADALAEILQRNKYHVDTVYNGEDGLHYASTGIYDCIVLDIMLPMLDSQNYTLSYGQEQIKLSLKEYQIMEIFMSNPKQIVSKEFFIEKIWGYESDVEYNNIEVYISFLRKKLQSIHANISIKTARGIGYFLEEQPA